MTNQAMEDDIALLKGTLNFLSQRIALQEQLGEQLRQAQVSELNTFRAFSDQLNKLKAEIKVLSIRQTAMQGEGGNGQEDEGLPLLLKNSGKKLNKRG